MSFVYHTSGKLFPIFCARNFCFQEILYIIPTTEDRFVKSVDQAPLSHVKDKGDCGICWSFGMSLIHECFVFWEIILSMLLLSIWKK